ncbi:MAG: hypothetical protein JXJ17_09880 [Anaerolineae bacterium]|nr:hypothetical protein [Anaerolineae bacterium]
MDREEKFYNMCISLPFEEIKDNRDERSIPELVHIAELRDTGNVMDAIEYAKSLMKMYPDNDLIPFMIAYIYYQRKFADEALEVAVEAIPKCPRKYRLYSVAGLAEFDRGRIPESLVWWSRSTIAQCKITDFQEHDPFLYLAHVAEILDAQKAAQALFTMSDAIEPGKLRLDEPSLEKLSKISQLWAAKPARRVIDYIDDTYLHA